MEKEKQIKLNKLKVILGKKLYNRLKPDDKELMIKTAGSIDFGYNVDLNKK